MNRRFLQLSAVCTALKIAALRPANWEDPTLSIGAFSFGEWLGGFLDGDGTFGLNQGKYPFCEITVHSTEVQALAKIKKQLHGSVTVRTARGKKANAYR